MPTPNWSLFAVVVLLATAALLVLSRASARAISAADVRRRTGATDEDPERAVDAFDPAEDAIDRGDAPRADRERSPSVVPTGAALLANVALTHGLLGVGLLALAWYAAVPLATVGVGPVTVASVTAGVGLGVGLYLASEATTAVGTRVGFEPDERLRAALAPEGAIEWAVLLLVILPLIAGAEELLFRGVLIGALSVGFDLSPWLLAGASSIAFGLAHSAQGAVGVVVTAVLGFVLAAAFVLTGSLAAVVLAHYTVDALEFVVREGVLD